MEILIVVLLSNLKLLQKADRSTENGITFPDPVKNVFSSLRTMDNKRKRLRISFAIFQRNYLPDGRVNETVATVEKLSDLSKPGVLDGIRPFVMNFNCV